MAKASARVRLAKAGDVDGLIEELEPADAADWMEAYQWLIIAAAFGSDEAGEAADDLLNTALKHSGDEGLAFAHWEVGRWWLLGEQGLPVDADAGLDELAYAAKLGVRTAIVGMPAEIEKLRKRLEGKVRTRFDKIFPAKKKRG